MRVEFCDQAGTVVAYADWDLQAPPYPIIVVEPYPSIRLDATIYVRRHDNPAYVPLKFTILPRASLHFDAEEVWGEVEWVCAPGCGAVNMPVRRRCRFCGAAKPDQPTGEAARRGMLPPRLGAATADTPPATICTECLTHGPGPPARFHSNQTCKYLLGAPAPEGKWSR